MLVWPNLTVHLRSIPIKNPWHDIGAYRGHIGYVMPMRILYYILMMSSILQVSDFCRARSFFTDSREGTLYISICLGPLAFKSRRYYFNIIISYSAYYNTFWQRAFHFHRARITYIITLHIIIYTRVENSINVWRCSLRKRVCEDLQKKNPVHSRKSAISRGTVLRTNERFSICRCLRWISSIYI